MRQYSDILGPVDSAFYYVERRETPMNIGALTLFDGDIEYEDLVAYIAGRIHQSPRYKQRVVQAALNLGQPTWIDDPDFSVSNHVKLFRVEPPVTDARLREAVGRLLSVPLDRSRPLWEVYLIKGGKDFCAVFFKVHHCMVDGLAAVELFRFLMDTTPEYDIPQEKPCHEPPPLPGKSQLVVDSVLRDIPHRFGLLWKLGRETVGLGSVLTDSEKRLKMMVAMAHLLNGNLKPIKKLPINGKNTGRQTMVWAEFSLEEVHAIRSKVGASVNDVMLSILGKAIEHYTMARGGINQPFVRVLMPVNMREDEEKEDFGNRISVLPVDIPFDIENPLEHLKAVTRFSRVMKESSLAYSLDMFLTLPSLIPAPLQSPVWSFAPTAFSLLAHCWCTNVAAMPIPVYVLGCEVKHVYGYFPLNPSMGLAGAVVSYNGRISITVVVDKGIIDDPEELEQHLKNAYLALKRAANVPDLDRMQYVEPVSPAIAPLPLKVTVPAEMAVPNGAGPDTVPLIPEPMPVAIGNGVVISSNGVMAVAEIAPAAVAESAGEQHYKLFSDGWAAAMQEALNHSVSYRRASTGWTAGSLALVMDTAPKHGFETPAAVLLDLYRGECRAARALPVHEALDAANFVIQGSYASWMTVLSGKTGPLVMLSTGRLHLKKGSLLRLLPYTRSATELVRCAQVVPWT